MSNSVTWTIRVRSNGAQRKLWGDNIESCWKVLRRLSSDLKPTQQIILKLLYHDGSLTPEYVRAGAVQFSSVAVYFDHQAEPSGIWYADRIDNQRRLSCCSRWNVSNVEKFITYYNN